MAPRQTFSDRLKELIEECGVSKFVLCRTAGISEAVLSRFLSGKQGMTLVTLDKLADVLGLELSVSVQKLPKPKPRGRKRRTTGGKTMTPEEYAMSEAMYHHEENFHTRRGIREAEEGILGRPALVVYNNHPYTKSPSLRDEETAEFRKVLAEAGIEELAYATYPVTGEGSGYTYAMVLGAGGEEYNFVARKLRAILRRSIRKMFEKPV